MNYAEVDLLDLRAGITPLLAKEICAPKSTFLNMTIRLESNPWKICF